jgi:hypothetical protein
MLNTGTLDATIGKLSTVHGGSTSLWMNAVLGALLTKTAMTIQLVLLSTISPNPAHLLLAGTLMVPGAYCCLELATKG